MKRVTLERAYVLFRRRYLESSLLVELFTPSLGRVSAVSKGAFRPRSSLLGLLQPFVPLLVSFSGKGDLMVLSQVEMGGVAKQLKGECLFAGFYLNELLMALTQKWDAHTVLYEMYEKTISALAEIPLNQKWLRSFEKCLLEELGYGLLPKSDISLHNTFSKDAFYRFTIELGFVLSESNDYQSPNNIFSGKSLLSIAKEDWEDPQTLKDAKRLVRFVLTSLLGRRRIYSRELFKI